MALPEVRFREVGQAGHPRQAAGHREAALRQAVTGETSEGAATSAVEVPVGVGNMRRPRLL